MSASGGSQGRCGQARPPCQPTARGRTERSTRGGRCHSLNQGENISLTHTWASKSPILGFRGGNTVHKRILKFVLYYIRFHLNSGGDFTPCPPPTPTYALTACSKTSPFAFAFSPCVIGVHVDVPDAVPPPRLLLLLAAVEHPRVDQGPPQPVLVFQAAGGGQEVPGGGFVLSDNYDN